MSLLIYKAKPNPIGKDRIHNIIPALQLAGEWIDIYNPSMFGVSLTQVELQHVAYTLAYPNGVWEKVFFTNWTLPSRSILRIHSGGQVPIEQLPLVDTAGANYHAFTGKGYVWNNDKNDYPRLINTLNKNIIDRTSYKAPVLGGRILVRKGDSLL